jgi:hypothetical protein
MTVVASEFENELAELEAAVDGFCALMKARLREKAHRGYRGWRNPALVGRLLDQAAGDVAVLASSGSWLIGGEERGRLAVDVANRMMMVRRHVGGTV